MVADENWDDEVAEWEFEHDESGVAANAALAHNIFIRDKHKFVARYPDLKVERIRRKSPFSYWLSGGLKPWTLVPGMMAPLVIRMDDLLARVVPESASFMDVTIRKN